MRTTKSSPRTGCSDIDGYVPSERPIVRAHSFRNITQGKGKKEKHTLKLV